jgi:putative tricarboxylic transport membrane protein
MKKMNVLRLSILIGLFCAMANHLCFVPAAADDYPKGPIRWLLTMPPGGSNDRAVRIMQPFLEKELGVPVIVENRPGAGGEVCTTYLYHEKPDGYKIMTASMPDLAAVSIRQNPVYGFEDIVPLIAMFRDFRVLLVKKDSPLNTLVDFIEGAKKGPGKMSIGVTNQSGPHFMAVCLQKSLNLDFKVVPFQGGGPAMTAVLGGHVTANWGDGIGRLGFREQTKCIAVSTGQPHPVWPEGKPVNDQLRGYGSTLPDLPLVTSVYVRNDFNKSYPERYRKLQNAFLKASQNKDYLEMEKKQQLDLIRLWEPGENFLKEFKEQYEFFKANKDILMGL